MEIDKNYIVPRFFVNAPMKDVEVLNSDTNIYTFKSTSDSIVYNQTVNLKLPKFLAEYKKFHQLNYRFEVNIDISSGDSIPIKVLVHKDQGAQQVYVKNGTRCLTTLKLLDSTKLIMIRFPQISPNQTITLRNPTLNVIEDGTYNSLYDSMIPILLIGGTNKTFINTDKIKINQLNSVEDIYCYYLRINLHKLGKFAISIPIEELNDEILPKVSDVIVLRSDLLKSIETQLINIDYKRLCTINIDKIEQSRIDDIQFVKPDVFLSIVKPINEIKCDTFHIGIGVDDKVFRPDKRNSNLIMFIDVCDKNKEKYREIVDICYDYIVNDLAEDGLTEQTMNICRNIATDKEFGFDDDYVKNGRYLTINERVFIKFSNKMNTSRIFISMNQNPVSLKYVSAMHSGCFIISPIDFEKYGFPVKKGEDYEIIDNIANLELNKIARDTDYNAIKQKIMPYNWTNISNRILSFTNHVEDIVKYTEKIVKPELPKQPEPPKPTIEIKSIPVQPLPTPTPVMPKPTEIKPSVPIPKPVEVKQPTPAPKPIPKPVSVPPKPALKSAPKPVPVVGTKKSNAMRGGSKKARAMAMKSKKPQPNIISNIQAKPVKKTIPIVAGKRKEQAMKKMATSKKDLQRMKKKK